MNDSKQLVQRMMARFPALGALLRDHLSEMEGELLPYLLLADVARWADAQVSTEEDAVRELTSWLEVEFNSAAPPEKDLIALGFVEVIPFAPEGDPLLRLLGPALHRVAGELGLLTPASE